MLDISFIFNSFIEGFSSILFIFLKPIILYFVLPGIVASILFKDRKAYVIGSGIGFILFLVNSPYI